MASAQTTVLLMTVLCLGTRCAPPPRLYMLFGSACTQWVGMHVLSCPKMEVLTFFDNP